MPHADLSPILDRAADVRRRLHRVPELGYEEHETAGVIRGELRRIGLDFRDGPADAPTATVAVVGDRGPCVLLRADIDALPIRERTGVEHASERDGVMHACGHDGHAANLLAVAEALAAEHRDLPCRVKLVWQPAEEGGGGGKRLVDAGLLEETGDFGPKVDAAFGLHGWPMLPVGTVSTRPGPLLAATDTFEATIHGTGGHAAFPHFTTDPIATACAAVADLQQVVSRETDPTEPAVVSVTRFRAGTANNVIPDAATIGGTVRTLTPEARAASRAALERRLRHAAEGGRCDLRFDWHEGYPPTVNDPTMADYVARLAGGDFLPAARPAMGGEDFAYYLEKVPGCFFLIGLRPAGRDECPALHTDRFDFTDAALATGVSMMLRLVREFDADTLSAGVRP